MNAFRKSIVMKDRRSSIIIANEMHALQKSPSKKKDLMPSPNPKQDKNKKKQKKKKKKKKHDSSFSSSSDSSSSVSLEDDDLEKELALLEEMENGGPQKTPVLFNADVSPLFLDDSQSSKKVEAKKMSLPIKQSMEKKPSNMSLSKGKGRDSVQLKNEP